MKSKLNRLSFGKVGAAMAFVMAASVLPTTASYAALKCEEIVARRSCSDSGPRTVEYEPGKVVSVPAPVIDGYPYACWSWNRRFQCVETEPTYSCDSGTAYPTVKADCSLTAASINASVNIRGINYITSADYTYRCAYGEFTTNDKLPVNKECVYLDPSDYTFTESTPSAPLGSNPSTAPSSGAQGGAGLTTSVDTKEQRDDHYVCYSAPVTTCSNSCYEDKVNPVTGAIEQVEVACTAPADQCRITTENCDGSAWSDGTTMDGALNLGPDGRCVKSTANYVCSSGEIPKCLSKDNCTLQSTVDTGIQENGISYSQEQTYICTNETKTCTEMADVSNCVHVNAWGWDNMSIASQVGVGLGEFNQAMAKLEGIEKGMSEDDLYIFSGHDMRCHYAVGNFLNTAIMIVIAVAFTLITGGASAGLFAQALASTGMSTMTANIIATSAMTFIQDVPDSKAFGGNCCKDLVIEGSDKWYKLGKCTADEVKLAVAKQKGLAVYIGEYCSKKGGFPIRQCVQKTRTYCVFDDMLALVVNEQGRLQLDALASADPGSTTTSAPVKPRLFNTYDPNAKQYRGVLNNGHWEQLGTFNKSQIWMWQYPGYCANSQTQAKAHELYQAEIEAVTDTTGTQPKDFDKQAAIDQVVRVAELVPFQECASTAGMATFLTCSKSDESCDPSKLPDGPMGVEFDYYGEDVTESDINWRTQEVRTFFKPTDYGVTATMPTDSSFAAVSSSVTEFISSVGSCKTTGECLFTFAVTDKTANNSLGMRKRTKEYVRFPMYTIVPNSVYPAIEYVNKDGTMNPADYQSDVNRGRGEPTAVATQRFIFHPHYQRDLKSTGNIHSALLLEYANANTDTVHPENDYTPILVPTSLPLGTAGFYPYGDPSTPGKYFYLSGGCDPNSRWCTYTIEVDLNIQRHPWGTPQAPRCWGFTIEQMTVLDFDKMDLSRWINSLNLDAAAGGLSKEAADAMTERTLASAQALYSSVKNNETTQSKDPGLVALVTNTDSLPNFSGDPFRAYALEVAVPSNWPAYYDTEPNNNPVSNAYIDWGDGNNSRMAQVGDNYRAFYAEYDYGDLAPGKYKVTVTLDTKNNGKQTLSTWVTVAPDAGGKVPTHDLDFNVQGTSGTMQKEETKADTLGGINQSPENLQTLAPGYADLFTKEGDTLEQKK
ncbi:conjugal transfer protein TraN [Comamonas thiooxydans]|uniref:conjugal transfer protein TraN n=1 Tax=Comamonas thiooxydans TaxID=363952 RepID=UPI000B41DDFE|nr:conjugal transfer protein TraN [Comamonas thiooxydans]